MPTQVSFELAEGLLGNGLDTLAEAEERGVLEVRADGIGFRHELACRAVESILPVIRRRAANRAVVRTLLAHHDPDIAQLVHHATQADDAAVLRYTPQAGRDAVARYAEGW